MKAADIRLTDVWKLAWGNLRRRASRTLLTVLGVVIGTACVVLMLSIGWSNYEEITQTIEQTPNLTRIEISDFEGAQSGRSAITDSTIEMLRAIPHVTAVSPLISMPATLRAGSYEASVNVTGIEPDVLNMDFQEGKMFSASASVPSLLIGGDVEKTFSDVGAYADSIDYEAYETYRPDIDWTGTPVELVPGYESGDGTTQGRAYRAQAAGVSKADGGSDSSVVYTSLAAARKLLAENREVMEKIGVPLTSYTQAYVRVDGLENMDAVLSQIRKWNLEARAQTEFIDTLREERSRQQTQLLFIGILSLAVSAIGIANTMYASVLERRKEIGVMKVLGMEEQQVKLLFFAEAALIGLIGGALGLLVSEIVLLAVNGGAGEWSFLDIYFMEGARIRIPVWVALGGLGVSLGTSLLASLWPARRAMRMSALDAMRSGRQGAR